jgi:hypothetical protein
MKYMVDIDNTICQTEDSNYLKSKPIRSRIQKINQLYDLGHEIVYWTARGMNSGKDWTEVTKKQLEEWGCKFNELKMNKPSYDVWIDDKAEWVFDK